MLIGGTIAKDLSDVLDGEDPVDFTNSVVRQHVMVQLSLQGQGPRGARPFLSASADLMALTGCRSNNAVYGRIDLIALFVDGLLTETSFVDLSTEDKCFAYLGPVEDFRVRTEDCKKETVADAVEQEEMLLGTNGQWWTGYTILVDSGNAVLDSQVVDSVYL